MLREFLLNMGNLCSEDKVLGARIGLNAVLAFDHELANPISAFAFKAVDRANPKARMATLFAWKNIKGIDMKKAKRCETLVQLLALNHYKNKYQTEEYDEEIAVMTAEVKAEPIPSVDSRLPLDTVVLLGYWSD